uniref:Uncharacterized protein n=1 Tax=Setaria digitata TaxID=48799 RepID=A0A915PGL0_9BILA
MTRLVLSIGARKKHEIVRRSLGNVRLAVSQAGGDVGAWHLSPQKRTFDCWQ